MRGAKVCVDLLRYRAASLESGMSDIRKIAAVMKRLSFGFVDPVTGFEMPIGFFGTSHLLVPSFPVITKK
jgi:hypothetical protein